jgi:hypothetical protein
LYADGKDASQERVITRNKPSRKREVMVGSEFLGKSVPEDPAPDRFFGPPPSHAQTISLYHYFERENS